MCRLLIGILISFMGLMIFFSGFHPGFTIFVLGFSFLIVVAVYLEGRSHTEFPTKTEIFVARLWLKLRLISGISASLAFFLLALYGAYKIYFGANDVGSFVFPFVSFLFACMSLWVGLYGWSRDVRRDRVIHAERKTRYSSGSK